MKFYVKMSNGGERAPRNCKMVSMLKLDGLLT